MRYLIVIQGPTAVGKSSVALEIAEMFNLEIISADARQCYKFMDIGTAKPSMDERKRVVHHLVDHVKLESRYTAGKFAIDAMTCLDEIHSEINAALLVGGSGLYIKALCEGLDEFPKICQEARNEVQQLFEEFGMEGLAQRLKEKDEVYFNTVDPKNPRRLIRALEVIESSGQPYSSFLGKNRNEIPFQPVYITLNLPREILYERINNRVDLMMEMGLLSEVRTLYPKKSLESLNTVGYKELFAFLDGNCSLEQAVNKIKQHSRNYAKRQLTWFNNRSKGKSFTPDQLDEISVYIKEQIGIA